MSMIVVTTDCPICKGATTLVISTEAYNKWRKGTLIQDAMPNLTAEEREALITGLCVACQEGIFDDSNTEEEGEAPDSKDQAAAHPQAEEV